MSDTVADLRQWLEDAEKAGELQTVRGAHWELEIGALSQVNYRRPNPKALLFDDITGYDAGLRVLTGTTSNPRLLGSVLGLGWDNTDFDLMDKLAVKPDEWVRGAAEFAPVTVDDGPLLANVMSETGHRPVAVPGAAVARGRRRPVHRHRLRRGHQGLRHRPDQPGRLPDAGAGRRALRDCQHRGRQARRAAPAALVRGRGPRADRGVTGHAPGLPGGRRCRGARGRVGVRLRRRDAGRVPCTRSPDR